MPELALSSRRFAIGSLAVTTASLPLYVVRLHVGPLPATALEVLIGITAIGYGLVLRSERRLPAARTPYDIPIVLLLAAGIIGVVVAPDHVRGLGIYRAYFIEAIAIFYIAVDLIRSREELRFILVIAGVGVSLFAVGQIVTFLVALAHHAVHIDAGPAFLNTSANSVALFLEPPLAFVLGLAMFPQRRWERWLAIGCTLLFLSALVLTLSRAAYIATAILAVWVVFSLPGRRQKVWGLAATALISLAVVELPFIGLRLGTAAHSAALRLSIYGEALRMLAQRPILGAGISGFPIRVAPFRPSYEDVELYPHNLWLTTWSEIGLLGVIAFGIVFFGLLFRGARASWQSNGLYRAVIWGSTGALVLYLVHGLFDSPYWKNDLSVEFWIVAALQVIAMRGARSSAQDS